MNLNYYVDIHCHPTLKPFGQTFTGTPGTAEDDPTSIWFYDPPKLADKVIDIALGFAPYSQSNFTAAVYGDVLVMGVSIYSPEISFFDNKLGESEFSEEMESIISGFGVKRIREICNNNYDYFEDIKGQYEFLKKLHNQTVWINHRRAKYIIANSYNDIKNAMEESEHLTLAIILSIEGGHSLGCGYPGNPLTRHSKEHVMKHVEEIKSWEFPPFYITLAHHFYNELCGHTKSLYPPFDSIIDQSVGMNTSIRKLGYQVIDKLLDDSNGNRILIDVKHMSRQARKKYYHLLDTKYQNKDIPVIFSHGGVNGLGNFSGSGNNTRATVFNEWDINLFDEEIIRIASSRGIFGLNFDQRIMASRSAIRDARGSFTRHKMLYNWSKLIWNNIQHIAQVLDNANFEAWNNIVIGSDFDGVINPVNGFWTVEEMKQFEDYLMMHAYNFMNEGLLKSKNRLQSDEIVYKIMRENALGFFKQQT